MRPLDWTDLRAPFAEPVLWVAFAAQVGIPVAEGMTRDDIIRMAREAGFMPAHDNRVEH